MPTAKYARSMFGPANCGGSGILAAELEAEGKVVFAAVRGEEGGFCSRVEPADVLWRPASREITDFHSVLR